ncbi:MAG: CDP-alcohol phosphatidyltransferase family protein [bacterium]|nr:CDP-alcohol phosphatidyltransferase family protein [bacterium]
MKLAELLHLAPTLQPQDYLLRATILPLIPRWVKPNHLTVVRFALTPPVIWLMLTQQYRAGTALFLLAAFTDALDGSLARIRHQITRWGQTFDPLADKLLMGSLFIILALPQFPTTVSLIVLIDLSFIIAGWHWKRQGYDIKANLWGKMKMNCQVIAIILLLIETMAGGPAWLVTSAHLALLSAILLAIASLITHGI